MLLGQDAYLNSDVAESLRGFPTLAPKHKHFQPRSGSALPCHAQARPAQGHDADLHSIALLAPNNQKLPLLHEEGQVLDFRVLHLRRRTYTASNLQSAAHSMLERLLSAS